MSGSVRSPTADCFYCSKPVRRNSVGIWGARKRDDPHPWYCDASPAPDKRHAPSPAGEMTEGQRIVEESLLDLSQDIS
jgi:hypothetical protein